MMTRILMGISTITLFFTLAPEAVEASPSRDGLITLTAQPWLSGGCQIGPRRSSGVLRSQRSLPREKPPPTNDPKKSAPSCRSDVLYRWGEEKTPFMRNGSEMDSSALPIPSAKGQNSGAVSSTSEIQE